jgi:hypothetical protein
MSAMSDFTELNFMMHIFRTGTWAKPGALWVSLHTGSLADDGTGTEVSGGSYGRIQRDPLDANWSYSGVGGVITNVADIQFASPTADWGLIIWAGVWDAATVGNLLGRAQLGSSKTVNNGDAAPLFPAGTLIFTAA